MTLFNHIKLSLLVCVLLMPVTSAFSQERLVSLSLSQVKVREAIEKFQEKSGYSLSISSDGLNLETVVDVNAVNATVNDVLKQIFAGQDIAYVIEGNLIKVSRSYQKSSASGVHLLKGVVRDSKGDPCPGATIQIQGTNIYTVADIDGKFSVESRLQTYRIVVSLLGCKSKTVVCTPEQTSVEVVLEDEDTYLDEVVVVGYGSQRRELVTNSITRFKPSDDNIKQALSPSELLEGRVAGMTVATQSGNLGTAERVSIRGSASLNASNEPLYVVDGIPLNNEKGSLYSYGEDLSSLSVLNLTDIESIEVLKDAASAAIYGSRATNGVILITTKSGREGKAETKVSYNTGVNLFPFRNRIKYADSGSWINVYNVAVDNYNAQMGYSPSDASYVRHIANPYEGLPDTDWLSVITRPGIFHNADISFSGGTKKTKFYIGGNFRSEEGTIKTNSILKANLKVNVSHEMTKWLQVGTNMSGNFLKNNRVPGANLGSTVIARAVEQRPFDRPFKPDGSYYLGGTDELSRHNPAQLMTESDSFVDNYRFLGSVYANIRPIQKLNIKLAYNTDVGYTYDYIYYNSNHPYCEDNGRIIEKNRLLMSNVFEIVGNYEDKWGDFDFSAMLGHSFQKTSSRANSIDAQNFPSPSYTTVGSAAVFSGATGGRSEYAIESYFTRVSLAYKERYLLNATLRTDGSSRFAPKHRWGLFPSVSVGWNISKENFWNSPSADLKFRLSYGKTGNQDGINNYAWQPLISSGSNYDGKSGIAVSSNGNENLTWETADQYDFGFDLNFAKGKFGIIFDAYLKDTYNLLYTKPTASTTGFTSIMSNIGSMRNYGFELTFDGHFNLGPVQWNTSLNVSHNKNRLTSLLNDEIITLNSYHALKVGEEVGAFYLYQWDGIYQYDGEVPQPQYELGYRAGDMKYHDFDGNGILNDKDRVICGSANPILSGGWNNTFKFKGFELGIFFTYSLGNKVYAAWMSGPTRLGNYQGLLSEWAEHYWTGPGSTNSYPRPIYSLHGNNSLVSTYYLKDGSHIRLSSLSFGYSFQSNVLEKIRLKGLRIFIQGENLALISKYPGWDPSISTSTDPALIGVDNYGVPRSTTFKLGVSVTF